MFVVREACGRLRCTNARTYVYISFPEKVDKKIAIAMDDVCVG